MLNQALELHKNGQWSGAEQIYWEILKKEPNNNKKKNNLLSLYWAKLIKILSKYLLINNTEGKFGLLRDAIMGTNNPRLNISRKAVNDDKIIK